MNENIQNSNQDKSELNKLIPCYYRCNVLHTTPLPSGSVD